jgi:hypothetical protein
MHATTLIAREKSLELTSVLNATTNSAQIPIKSAESAKSDDTLFLPRITRGHFSELSEVDHQHALA